MSWIAFAFFIGLVMGFLLTIHLVAAYLAKVVKRGWFEVSGTIYRVSKERDL